MTPSENHRPVGQRYRKIKPLAAGGMGEVYLAEDSALEREVALKTVELTSPQQNDAFLHEARVLGALEHPHIVPVHDLGEDDQGRPFLTMQYIRGDTLAQVIERLARGDAETHRHFSFSRRLRLVQQICEALSYAHSRGVLHRDIKPANIMLGSFGEVIVVDWGLSARAGRAQEHAMTPAYAAPERIQADVCDERSEVYSVGALMYELLALRPPFEGDLNAMLTSILQDEPRWPDSVPGSAQGRVPLEVSYIIMRALKKRPEERFADPRALAEEIQKYLDGEAPVVCVHTGYKRLVQALARFIDNHGRLAIIVSAASLTFLLVTYGILLAYVFF